MSRSSKESKNKSFTVSNWIQQRFADATLAWTAPHQLSWLAQPKEAYLPGAVPTPRAAKRDEEGGASKAVHKARRNSLAAAIRSRGGAPESASEAKQKASTPTGAPSVPMLPLGQLAAGKSQSSRSVKKSARSATSARGATKQAAAPAPTGQASGVAEMQAAKGQQSPSGSWVSSGTSIVDQMNEFFGRGILGVSQTGRSSLTPASMPEQQALVSGTTPEDLQQRLQRWAAASGVSHPPRVASSFHEVPQETPGCPRRLEVALIWLGVEVRLQLTGFPSFSAGTELEFNTVVAASTECCMGGINTLVERAARASLGGPVEAFLDSLAEAWGIRTCSTLQALAPGTPPRSLQGEVDSEDEEEAADTFDSYEDEDSCYDNMASFEAWLSDRPPLFRFEQAAKGLAWDFPLSRQEKKELLIQQLFAEEAERMEQISQMKAAQEEAINSKAARLSRASTRAP